MPVEYCKEVQTGFEEIFHMSKKMKAAIWALLALFLLSAGFLIYILSGYGRWITYMSYLQEPQEIYNMEAGIIKGLSEFQDGEECKITYDFDNTEYPDLLARYEIDKIAGNGSEFEKARALMNAFADRLHHKSDYDNHINMNAVELLEYSLDNRTHGINCRAKAQILNEMCLALGLYSRKVWINPNSVYDSDCHVVNEVWDTELNQWVMLDITNNYYWVDETGKPLSVLEIREHIANQEFCSPVTPDDNLKELQKSLQRNYENFLYIAKNMVYMYYCTNNSLGETENFYIIMPKNCVLNESAPLILVSKESIESSPFEK